MKPFAFFAAGILGLTGCDQMGLNAASGSLPLENGYRAAGDKCRHVGENEFTSRFAKAGFNLAACPKNYEGFGLFVFETEANWETEVQGYILLTVPKGR